MPESFVYDKTLRELFQDVPKTLIELLVNQNIKEVLETSFPRVEERRVDLLTRLEDNTLFHLEIQSINDPTMPKRMLKYALLIYDKLFKKLNEKLLDICFIVKNDC